MDQLLPRVRVVLQEIAVIRAELSTPAADPATGLAIPKLTADELRNFKREIDHLRLFLWAYLDMYSAGSSDPKNRLDQIRMESAADMLRLLQQTFHVTGVPPTTEGRRLSAEVRAMTRLLPS